MSDDRLTFKQMCAEFDVTPRTLRYYEYIELLQPDREGRARYYGPRERARMKLILKGRKFGFQLEEIRQWLLIYEREGTHAQWNKWIDMADGQIKELTEQRAQLDDALTELKQLRRDIGQELARAGHTNQRRLTASNITKITEIQLKSEFWPQANRLTQHQPA